MTLSSALHALLVTVTAASSGLAASIASADATLNPGNGHHYEAVWVAGGITWSDAAAGGFLATPMSEAKNAYVFALVDNASFFTPVSVNNDIVGPWLGIYSSTDSPRSSAMSPEVPWAATPPWGPSQPDTWGGVAVLGGRRAPEAGELARRAAAVLYHLVARFAAPVAERCSSAHANGISSQARCQRLA